MSAIEVPLGTIGASVTTFALAHDCHRCGAKAGENCRTASGKERQWWRLWDDDLSRFERQPDLHSDRAVPADWAALHRYARGAPL